MKGVHVAGFTTALIVAVLGLLNIHQTYLVILTLPNYFITLVVLLVINALIIILCDNIVGGFSVDSFWTALFLVLYCPSCIHHV
jgi:putative membrane protein